MKLKRFMMFLVVLVVSVSLGMMTYYFVRNDEVVSISTRPLYMNVGSKISLEDLEFSHTHANESTTIDFNAGGEEVKEIVEYKENTETGDQWYEAKKGGKTTIKITTSNKKFPSFSIDVVVGDGSNEFPFVINNELEFSTIGEENRPLSASYQLADDITLTKEFVPIGIKTVNNLTTIQQFTGKFDGNGYSISGLSIKTSYEKAGLFAHISSSATVQRLILKNADIEGSFQYVGAIAGQNDGVVTRCTVESTSIKNARTDENAASGLVIGYQNCAEGNNQDNLTRGLLKTSATGSILAKNYVGGLIGMINNGVLQACWSNVDIDANGATYAGGLVGKVDRNAVGNMMESYSISKFIQKAQYSGGLIGIYDVKNTDKVSQDKFAMYGLYYNDELADVNAIGSNSSTKLNVYAVNAVTTAEMKAGQETYILTQNTTTAVDIMWHFAENIWYTESGIYPIICDNASAIPEIKVQNPDNPGDDPEKPDDGKTDVIDKNDTKNIIQYMTEKPDGAFALDGDQDLKGATYSSIPEFTGFLTSKGEGTKYTISNFTISTNNENAGLFGILNGTITNVIFKNVTVNVTGATNAGALAGILGLKSRIYNVDLVNVKVSGESKFMGAFAGLAEATTLGKINVTNGELTNTSLQNGSATGGIIGYNNAMLGYRGVNNTPCGVDAINTSVSAYSNVGGIVGINNGLISYANATMTEQSISVTAMGSANSTTVNAGGIAGFNQGTITYSNSNAMSVFASRTSMATSNGRVVCAGGVVGQNGSSAVVLYCYAKEGKTSTAGNNAYVGGVVGYNFKGDIMSCGNESEVSGNYDKQVYAGGVAGVNKGKLYKSYNIGNVSGSYAGGIVALNDSVDNIGSIGLNQLRGLKTGIVTECYTSGDVPTDQESYTENASKNTISGVVVGGICAKMDFGYIANCYTRCLLQTGTTNATIKKDCGVSTVEKGGLIGQIDGSESKYGLLENSVSFCDFDKGAITTTINKYETVSPIFSSGKRATGTILNCAVNRSASGSVSSAQNVITNITNWLYKGYASGSTILGLKGGETTTAIKYADVCGLNVWALIDGYYPILNAFTK